MDPYATEDQQVEALKTWWKQNGVSIVVGLVIGLAALGGYRYWQALQLRTAEQASAGYQEMISLVEEQKSARAIDTGDQIQTKFGDTNYATLAALTAAKLAVDQDDNELAMSKLQWVIDNGKEVDLREVAIRRMARLLLSGGRTEAAWELVTNLTVNEEIASWHELKGDILLAEDKVDEARAEYVQALALTEAAGGEMSLLQLKLDDLGIIDVAINDQS